MELNLLIAVTGRNKAKDYTAMMRKNGLSTILTLSGRGTASQDVLSILGLESSEKVLLLAAADRAKTAAVFRDARNKLYIDMPGNGILTATPIRCIGGTKTLNYLTNQKTVSKSVPDMNFNMELVFVILNSGFTEEVMDAARTAGAGGGTIIEAKGTGAKYAHKFLGITIAEDKQIVLIVAKSSARSAIIGEIMKNCGPGTEAGAVAFSLPATQIAGLRLTEDEEELEEELIAEEDDSEDNEESETETEASQTTREENTVDNADDSDINDQGGNI